MSYIGYMELALILVLKCKPALVSVDELTKSVIEVAQQYQVEPSEIIKTLTLKCGVRVK